ncbi:hypothetical protein FRX31_009782, partial [Thalictrum thalictroides]
LWWRYLVSKRDSPVKETCVVYERALRALPNSYKVSFTEENVLLQHVHFMTNICAVVGGKARVTLPCILHWLLS